MTFSRVIAYVYGYAAETLTEITIRTPMSGPLPNVEKVFIELYRWPKGSVKNLFPKLKSLKCYYRKHANMANIMENVPNSEYVELGMVYYTNSHIKLAKDDAGPIYMFLNLNPQLQGLANTNDSRCKIISMH